MQFVRYIWYLFTHLFGDWYWKRTQRYKKNEEICVQVSKKADNSSNDTNTALLWKWNAVSLIATCRFTYSKSYGIKIAQKKLSTVRLRGWYNRSLRSVQLINFTIQSIQIGFSVTTSINTLAGCISLRARWSEIIYLPIAWAASFAAFSIATCCKACCRVACDDGRPNKRRASFAESCMLW